MAFNIHSARSLWHNLFCRSAQFNHTPTTTHQPVNLEDRVPYDVGPAGTIPRHRHGGDPNTNVRLHELARATAGALPLAPQERTTHQLSSLPTELISMICYNLDIISLLYFRLACRKLAAESSSAFELRFFDYPVAILHPISFQVLSEEAHHAELSKYITTVAISAENEKCATTTNENTNQAGHDVVEDWWEYARRLRDIISTLPKLRTIRLDSISSSNAALDHCVGIRCGYTALGWRGFQVHQLDKVAHICYKDNAFVAVLVACYDSGAGSTSVLEISLRKHD